MVTLPGMTTELILETAFCDSTGRTTQLRSATTSLLGITRVWIRTTRTWVPVVFCFCRTNLAHPTPTCWCKLEKRAPSILSIETTWATGILETTAKSCKPSPTLSEEYGALPHSGTTTSISEVRKTTSKPSRLTLRRSCSQPSIRRNHLNPFTTQAPLRLS